VNINIEAALQDFDASERPVAEKFMDTYFITKNYPKEIWYQARVHRLPILIRPTFIALCALVILLISQFFPQFLSEKMSFGIVIILTFMGIVGLFLMIPTPTKEHISAWIYTWCYQEMVMHLFRADKKRQGDAIMVCAHLHANSMRNKLLTIMENGKELSQK